MKVLFIGVRKNEEEITSAPQKISNYLYNRLSKKYKDFYYYGTYEDEIVDNPSKLHIINQYEAKGPISKLGRYIREKKIGVVYFARYRSLWALYIVILKFFYKFKLVYTVHGIVRKESQINKSFKFYHKICEKILLKKCDKIIVVSHELKNELLGYYPFIDSKIIAVINNGVELTKIKEKINIRENYKLDKDKKIIFTIGVRKIKNIEKLVEEYVGNNNLYNSAYLLIAGEIDTEFARSIFNRYKDYPNIRFVGLVDPNHLNNIYEQSDIYVQISEFETFGMAMVEALLHRKNVLISSHLPIAKYFNEDEVCFYNRSQDILSDRILECMNGNSINEMGYRKVCHLFNWDKISEDYYLIFKEV